MILAAVVIFPTILGVGLTLGPVGAGPALAATLAIDLVVLGGIWLAMRPGRADLASKEDLDRAIQGGRPLVVEFYSNFCLICMANRQVIRIASRSLRGAAGFARIELPKGAGARLGKEYGVFYTPSYLVFDAHGDRVRTIVPDNVTPLANGYRVLDQSGSIVSRAQRITPEFLADIVRFAT